MKFEYIVGLIILFNVVTALLKKRANGKGTQSKPANPKSESKNSSTRPQSKPELSRDRMTRGKSTSQEGRAVEGEHAHTDRGRSDWESGEHEDSAKYLKHRSPSQKERVLPKDVTVQNRKPIENKLKEKATGVGKEILEQLAKELGLELPEAAKPAKPKPKATVPVPMQSVTPIARSPLIKETIRTPTKVRAVAQSVKPIAKSAGYFSMPGNELSNVENLRRAMVFREILDPPVSKRRR